MVVILSTFPALHAQTQRTDTGSGAFACTGCGVFVMIAIALFILNVIPLVWVAKDAKSRRVDAAELWIALVLFFSVLGLVGYLICRPKDPIMKCPHCGNYKREVPTTCPHCHAG